MKGVRVDLCTSYGNLYIEKVQDPPFIKGKVPPLNPKPSKKESCSKVYTDPFSKNLFRRAFFRPKIKIEEREVEGREDMPHRVALADGIG